MSIDPSTIQLLVGVIIPVLVGIVSKEVASSRLKAALNVGLSALAGGLVAAVGADGIVNTAVVINGAIETFVVSIATYYGFWKPTGAAGAIQARTRDIGISDI